MNKNYGRLVAVRDELAAADPTLSLDIVDFCGDPNTPCLHLIVPRAVECYVIWRGQWMVKDLLASTSTAADLGVNAKTNPQVVALSVIAASMMHELDASTQREGMDVHGEPDSAALEVVRARMAILGKFADGSATNDTATQKHAQELVNVAEPFVSSIFRSLATHS